MNDDDETIDPYSLPLPGPQPGDIAERLMLLPEHAHLSEHDVQLGWLMRNTPKEKGGKTELGSVHAVKTMAQGAFKDLFTMMLERLLFRRADYVVVLDAAWWAQAAPIDREALIYHELCHIKQAVDQYGAPKFDKDGYPVFRLVEHDVTAFNAEVARYGSWTQDIGGFLSAARGAA